MAWFGCRVVAAEPLLVGFAAVDITPKVTGERPVYLAGYGWNRRATGVHDPLYARAVVLDSGEAKIAMVSVDVVGLQFPLVRKVRAKLPSFAYVVVSSTHNHEGPDTMGIWGKSPTHRGANDVYLDELVGKIVSSVKQADTAKQTSLPSYGTASDQRLLRDSRKPFVKDATLRVLRFDRSSENGKASKKKKTLGVIVQWNCHPEALGSKNTLITADFPYATINSLRDKYDCHVVLFSGAVGGLMAPARGIFKDEHDRVLLEGQFEYAEAYGKAVAELAEKAMGKTKPINLHPFQIKTQAAFVPVKNPLYRLARVLGVLKRNVRRTGKPGQLAAPSEKDFLVETEVGCLRLGNLSVACIPGEIYPELVYGEFQAPQDAAADFPNAATEPVVANLMPTKQWMLLGLANDEIGYIIPKSQWDRDPPFAYGRKNSQYGEINSCGPDTAPILMKALQEAAAELCQ